MPLKIGSRYGLMTRLEVALIKAEEEEKSKKKGKKSARGTRSPKRSATKSREKSASPEKKDDKGTRTLSQQRDFYLIKRKHTIL